MSKKPMPVMLHPHEENHTAECWTSDGVRMIEPLSAARQRGFHSNRALEGRVIDPVAASRHPIRWLQRSLCVVVCFATMATHSRACAQLILPVITVHPQSQNAVVGADVTFSITITNTATLPLTYRLRKGTVNLATNVINDYSTSFTLRNVQTNDAGTYTIGVLSAAGSKLSSNAVLVVRGLFSATATPVAESCAPANGVPDPGELVTFEFALANTNAPATSNLVATLEAGNGILSPSGLQAYEGLFFGGPPVARPFTFVADAGCGSNIIASLRLWEGTNDLGRVRFDFRLGPTDRECCYDQASADLALTMSSTIVSTGLGSAIEYLVAVTNRGPGTATSIRLVNPQQPRLTLVSASSLAGTCVINEGVGVCDLADLPRDAGTTVTILANLTGPEGTSVSNTATVSAAQRDDKPANNTATVVLSPPVIITQPQSQTVRALANVTFSVVASGPGPIAYQWQQNGTNVTDNDRIVGAQTPTLRISNVQPSDAGAYSLRVGTAIGVVRSSEAVLIVVPLVAWGRGFFGQTTIPLTLTNVAAVAAGLDDTFVLNRDGTVVAWGYSSSGQTNVPPGLSNVAAIACNDHILALLSNGTVVAWGYNGNGQTNVPSNLANVVEVAAGITHSLALKMDGTVVAWGAPTLPNVPVGLGNVVAIAAGANHSLALKIDRTLVAWGFNNYGQTTVPQNLSGVTAVAAGSLHSVALKEDGTVVAWGANFYGQTNVPTGLSNVVAIAAGEFHCLALKADGRIVAWGYNSDGETDLPPGLSNVVAIAAGRFHNVALLGTPRSPSPPSLDTSFNPNANGYVANLAVQSDGQILLGGEFTSLGGQPRTLVGRLNSDGTSEPGFSPTLSTTGDDDEPSVESVIVLPDQRILVGGYFTVLNGQLRGSIARFNPDGMPDGSFNVESSGGGIYAIAPQADGQVLIGGRFDQLGSLGSGWSGRGLARLNVGGTIDLGFTPQLGPLNAIVTVLALQPDGRILIAGFFSSVGAIPRNGIARLYANGAVDHGFDPGVTGYVTSFAVQRDGKILVGGSFNQLGGVPRENLARLNGNGTIDLAFDPGADAMVSSIALQTDGRILVGGLFSTLAGRQQRGIGRLNSDGSADRRFDVEASARVSAVAIQADGRILVAGRFVALAGEPCRNIGRLNNTGRALETLTTEGSVLTWMRGGTGPEVWHTRFDVSSDGVTWTTLGVGVRIPGGWRLDGAPSLQGRAIRGRGLVSGSHGSSGWYVETIIGAPFLSLQPSSLTNFDGTSARFTVGAEGTPPFGYQWRKDGTNILGATNDTLELTDVRVADAGNYSVVVENAFGARLSAEARLDVTEASPTILGPISQDPYFGGPIVLRIAAEGAVPLHYQWIVDGMDISGATNATLTIANNVANREGCYSVRVSNAFGTATSSCIRLTVAQVVAWGGNTFGLSTVPSGLENVVSIAAGAGYSLALRADGTVVAWGTASYAGYGQINVPRDLTNVVAVAAGYLLALALKSDGTVVSWGTDWTGAIEALRAQTNVAAIAAGMILKADGTLGGWGAVGSGAPNGLTNLVAISAGGFQSLALRADGTVVALSGMTVPQGLTNVVAIAAGDVHGLALRADGTVVGWCLADCSNGQADVPPLRDVVAIAAGGYHSLALKADGTVVAWGVGWYYQTDVPPGLTNVVAIAAGQWHSLALIGEELPARPVTGNGRPVLTIQPVNRTVADGDNPELVGMAVGQGMTYQWQRDGTNVVGATSNRLPFVNAQPEDSGDYRVIVSNALGAVTSRVARLTVLLRPRLEPLPEQTLAAVGSDVTLAIEAIGTPPLRYQWRKNGANIPGATNATYTLTNAQISDGGSYSVVVANDVGVAISSPILVIVEVPQQPPGDNFADRVLLTGATNSIGGTNRWATREPGEPYHAGKFGSNSVWYRWQAPSNGIATFRTVGSTFDTLLGVYTNDLLSKLGSVASDEDRGGFFTSQLRFNTRTNVEYAIAIDGFVGGQGTFILSWDLEPTDQSLPVITNPPSSRTVRRGDPVTLSVTAIGSGLTYQWHFNGAPISGATTSTLTLSHVQPQDVGSYTVAITNSAGRGIESLQALVEIGPFPGVQAQDKLEDLFSELRPPPGVAGFLASSIPSTFVSVAMGTIDYHITSTRDASSQSWEPNHCGVIGGASKWFDFHANDEGTVVLDTQGSTFDTVLTVYRKVGLVYLAQNEVTCNTDTGPGAGWSRVSFEAQRGSNYWVVVDGADPKDPTGRVELNWAMGRLPVSVATPVFEVLRAGQARRLWAGFTNAIPPPSYRWLRNGQLIVGATNEWLDLSALGLTNAGSYSVVASNALGAVQQLIAQLTAPVLTSELKVAQGQYRLTLAPVEFPGLTMVLESSSDLEHWTPVLTQTNFAAPLTLDFPLTPPQRFFRARPGP